MNSRRSRRSSGWSDWTWDPGYKCLTRSRESGKGGLKWEFKNEHGQVTSTHVKSSQTVSSSQTGQFSNRTGEEDAVFDEDDEEEAEDGQSIGTVTQEMSDLNMQSQSSSPSQWNSGPSTQNPLLPKRRNAGDNGTGSPYNTNSLPSQGQYPAPRWQGSIDSTIRTSNPGTSSEHDRHFRVHDSKRFKFGKVFKIMWSEPHGSNGTAITSRGATRNNGFSKMRRFVIVSCFDGHCLCLPILTYTNKGTLKYGVHADDHAVIYTNKDTGPDPCLLPGESLKKKALRMEPENSSHKLDPASRVNYAKIYTVEHNVKVQFIGTLTRNAQAQLSADYNSQHPPIKEIVPEPGYVVHRNSAQYDTLPEAQGYEITQEPTTSFHPASVVGQNESGYSMSSPMANYDTGEPSSGVSDHSPGYTTQPPATFQYANMKQMLQDDSFQTPRIPHSDSSYPASSGSMQQPAYSSNMVSSGLNSMDSGYRAEGSTPIDTPEPSHDYLPSDE